MSQDSKHILALIVDNEAGTLGRVVGLFSGRGYNIHSLTVSEVDPNHNHSRITITTHAPEHTINHIITLLERLVPVHSVLNLTASSPFVQRALLLIKVHAKGNKRNEIMRIAEQFGAVECDASEDTLMFELSDIPSKIDEFIELMESYEISEMARTGITALSRGSTKL